MHNSPVLSQSIEKINSRELALVNPKCNKDGSTIRITWRLALFFSVVVNFIIDLA